MLITAIAQSACVCKLVCVCLGEIYIERISGLLYEQPPHYYRKGLSGCFVGSLSLEQTQAGLHYPLPPRAKLHAAAVLFYNHTEGQNRSNKKFNTILQMFSICQRNLS